MTSVWVAEHGWTYLMAMIDCCTREIVAWQLELRCRADEAIALVERAATAYRIEPGELVLGSDNGSAFTARRFRATLAQLGIRHRRGGVAERIRNARRRTPRHRRLRRPLPPPTALEPELPHAARGATDLGGSTQTTKTRGLTCQPRRGAGQTCLPLARRRIGGSGSCEGRTGSRAEPARDRAAARLNQRRDRPSRAGTRPLLRGLRTGQAIGRALRRTALAAPGAARRPPRPGSRTRAAEPTRARTRPDASRSHSRRRPTRTRPRRRRAAERKGPPPANDPGATRRRTNADSSHLQARHPRGLRNVRKSGRNQTLRKPPSRDGAALAVC